MGKNQSIYQQIAARVRGIGKELLAIADTIDAHAPHLSVTLPQPDLFSGLADLESGEFARESNDREGILTERGHDGQVEESAYTPYHEQPKRRTYQRNAKRMTEAMMVDTYAKMGKAQGYCARNDIERTLVRITGRNREDVREAVNRTAELMQVTCVKSRSYRYYPRSLRAKIINVAVEELERI
jgi:hypothetical protein